MGNSQKVDEARQARPQNLRPTIGLFIGQMEERYQSLVWPGIADMAQERDANLICFVGSALRSPYEFDIQRNVIYDLASAENMDGLVFMSGTLGNFVDLEELRTFCERYRPLPMVSIALALGAIPSVLVDNEKGMRDAINHLIEVHSHRRIAFIRGPEGHQEAEARYRAYTEVLAKHGLPPDPNLIAPGDFTVGTGLKAIQLLFDERKDRPCNQDSGSTLARWSNHPPSFIRSPPFAPCTASPTDTPDTQAPPRVASPLGR
jgi:DNA-binding LacI/PurR family transcriptional regulator